MKKNPITHADESVRQQVLESLDGKRLLITGGAGYLASGILALLRNANCRIVRMDRPEAVFGLFQGKARLDDVKADIRDPKIWDQALEGIDLVIHLAGQTSASVADADPLADWAVNVEPMVRMLDTCRRKGWRPDVVFAGTVTQTGVPNRLPVDEMHPDSPITAYDLHKCVAEDCLKYSARMGILRGTSLRLANVFGPGPRSSGPSRGVLNMMIRRALQGETLTIYGDGSPVRDYVYVEDVALAFLFAARGIANANGRHFVIGSGKGFKIAEAVRLVASRVAIKTGRRVPVIHVPPPTDTAAIENRSFVADTGCFMQATGWRPTVSLADGIDRSIDAILAEAE